MASMMTTGRVPVPLVLSLLAAASLHAGSVSIVVLATTDLHGNLYPVDYFTAQPAARGLAKVATLIEAERARQPNTILIDCGDTIQGTPLEYVYQKSNPLHEDPMMLAMNRIGYDAMTLGNHEFNFGLENLQRARSNARFPWLSANTKLEPRSKARAFDGYLLKTVGGVKVAVIGITTPAVPTWEKPENYAGYRFEGGVEAVKRAVTSLAREHPDLVIVAAHAGLGEGSSEDENMVRAIAAVPGIDAIVFGHTHQELAEQRIGGVLITQPKNWGMSLARLAFTLEGESGKPWRVVEKKSSLVKVTDQTPADPGILEIAKPFHEAAERYLSTEVARSPAPLDGILGRAGDSALVDAIHEVQLHYAKAEVSFASLFNSRVSVPTGPVTVRQIASLYIYDNELYAIEGDGRMVKDALENAARYFVSCAGEVCGKGPLTNKNVFGFNYDMAQGVSYEIDISKPEGSRIVNLTFKGTPLAPDRKLRIAVNNYRAGGSAGYSMFRGAKVVWRSAEDIRQLMIAYFTERGELPAKADGNWRILPELARKTLERDARAEAARSGLF
ncbi:MAG: hypothetical protein EXQ52_11420 [Bryobacterales bacterium]|nr:hypothetical protein [Bryobacterales bacterium]